MAAFVPGVKVVIWEHFPVTDSVTKARGRLARKIASVVASRIVTLTKSDKDLYADVYKRQELRGAKSGYVVAFLQAGAVSSAVNGGGRAHPAAGLSLIHI